MGPSSMTSQMIPALPRVLILGLAFLSLAGRPARSQEEPKTSPLVDASEQLLSLLNADERKVALLPSDDPRRLDWGCGERLYRRGLPLEFASENRSIRHALSPLLASLAVLPTLDPVLTELGDETETKPLSAHAISDKCHLTLFGRPAAASRWSLSLEGSRISLNFVVDHGRIVSSTPQMIAWRDNDFVDGAPGWDPRGVPEGMRELVATFSAAQRDRAAYRESPAAVIASEGEAQVPLAPALGLRYAELDPVQQELARRPVVDMCRMLPREVANDRLRTIAERGWDEVHFGWAGSENREEPHSFRIQGPTFLLECVATVSDELSGDGTVDIWQCVWRSRQGDFGLPLVGDSN